MNEKKYYNVSDGSLHTRKEHISFTPDEEWMETGKFSSVDSYIDYLIDIKQLIEQETFYVKAEWTSKGFSCVVDVEAETRKEAISIVYGMTGTFYNITTKEGETMKKADLPLPEYCE